MPRKPKTPQPPRSQPYGLRFAPQPAQPDLQNAQASSQAASSRCSSDACDQSRCARWDESATGELRIEPKSAMPRRPQHAWEMTLDQFRQHYFPEWCSEQPPSADESLPQRDAA